jgi:hypothetical protein
MDLSQAKWRKSSRSSASGNCVEVADNLTEGVAVRDTKDRDGGTLAFQRSTWSSFLDGVKAGEFGPGA